MHVKRSNADRTFSFFNTLFLLILIVICIYPLLYVLFASVSDPSRMMQHTGLLLKPYGFTLGSYGLVFRNPMIPISYLNTIFYVVVGTCVNMIMSVLGAFVLTRHNCYWNKIVIFMVIVTLFFSGGLIPFYLTVKGLGLSNTVWSIIFPSAISTWNLLVMRTSFASVPAGIEESAKIDGANDFTVLFRIVVPLSMPIIAVMILFYGVGRWNAWFYAAIFLKERTLFPLQLILREILIASGADGMMTTVSAADKEPFAETIKYATVVVATLPILVIYPFLQKYFVKGIMIGAIKE